MDTPLWERQPWDTNASYKAFKDHYLPENEPGRLIKAYRKHWRETRPETGAKQARGTKGEGREPTAVPGSWNNWNRGCDSAGKPIPAAYTWAQRAAAFDAHIAHLELQKLAKAKAKSKEARLRTIEGAFSQATIAISQYDLRPKIGPDGKLTVPELPPFRDIINAIDKLANNLRIEYGDLPQQRMEISGTPLVAAPERPSYSHLTDEEILERLAQLDAKRTGRIPDSE